MLNGSPVITFITTAQPEAARAFYEGTLGLEFKADEPFALVFDAHGTMLRIAKTDEHTPQPNTVLGWDVADIAATAQDLKAKGVVFARFDGMEQDALGVWQSPAGAQVAWFKDPDGNLLSLTQF